VASRLAWISAASVRGLDEDEPVALPALRAAGLEVDVVDWDDPDVQWASYDRAVLRSTWDYTSRLGPFTAWLEAVAPVTELLNPLPMVRWNLDKNYLSDLARAGVPVIPTTFVAPGRSASLPAGALVVKPAVGAGSRGVASFGPDDHGSALAHIARLHDVGTVLVQPLLASVSEQGEWPLIFLDGRYSHAANKRVKLADSGAVDELFAAETNTPHVADAEQIAVAQAAIDVVTERFGVPTYARVDLVRDDEGRSCVLEVELIEPSLFLPQAGPEPLASLVRALQ
jgi:glutathione synthase/RimK-type ligase-like ATP-grasp enzyme